MRGRGRRGSVLDITDGVQAELLRNEESRSTQLEKNRKMREALAALSVELDAARDTGKLSRLDVLHQKNVEQGTTKFRTLRKIRSGNTRGRIIDFEDL